MARVYRVALLGHTRKTMRALRSDENAWHSDPFISKK